MNRTALVGLLLLTVTSACGGNGATGPSDTSGSCRIDFVDVPDAPVPRAGGTFAATFTTSCTLSVTSNQPWITVTSASMVPASTFTVTYTVEANPTGAIRIGMIVFARGATDFGGGFTVAQLPT
jgi:hypothetical protein